MTSSKPTRQIDAAALERLARVARLPLTRDEQGELLPLLQAAYGLIDRLDEVPLGETFPAGAFDLRPR
ncbi:MAG TPA: hypothetical protein VF265_05090 [Nevskiaceae bacterium]